MASAALPARFLRLQFVSDFTLERPGGVVKFLDALRPDTGCLLSISSGSMVPRRGLLVSWVIVRAVARTGAAGRYPIARFAWCTGRVNNVHVQPRATNRYGRQRQNLQYYRYRNLATCRHDGGLVVSDAIGRQSGTSIFR